MSNANVTLVQSLYDAFKRGDIAAILDALTPDADWQVHADPRPPPRRGGGGGGGGGGGEEEGEGGGGGGDSASSGKRPRPLTRIPSLRSESDLSPHTGRGGASRASEPINGIPYHRHA